MKEKAKKIKVDAVTEGDREREIGATATTAILLQQQLRRHY